MRTTFHSRKRTVTIGAALTAVLALALAACNGDDYASGSTQAGPTASADKAGGSGGADHADQGAGTSTGGSDQGVDTGTGETSDGKVDMCRYGVLDATAADNTTDKTDGVVTVTFKNVADSDCRRGSAARKAVDRPSTEASPSSVTLPSGAPSRP